MNKTVVSFLIITLIAFGVTGCSEEEDKEPVQTDGVVGIDDCGDPNEDDCKND